ncbi:MAG: hypothetical protein ACYC1M_00635 [Armatimonadota bacterium]
MKAAISLRSLMLTTALILMMPNIATSEGVVQRVELVTSGAKTEDPGNNWGGHQTRIVRNQHGVFTAYIVPPSSNFPHTSAFHAEWRLAMRTGANQWQEIAKGPSGREPVNILAAPDGTVRLVAWPNKVPEMWTITHDGTILSRNTVPSNCTSADWPYCVAGINAQGDMAILANSDSDYYYSYYSAEKDAWSKQTSSANSMLRHCYCYVFPGRAGEVSMVGTRDVPWRTFGLQMDGYAFTAFGYFHTHNLDTQPSFDYMRLKEAATLDPKDMCNAQESSYIDTDGKLHVIYQYRDKNTPERKRHMVFKNGVILKDVLLPVGLGWLEADIIQNSKGRFFLITPKAIYPCTSEDGTELGRPVPIELGYKCEYSGMAISDPRSGVPLNDFVDCVFPSGNGKQVVYCRLALDSTPPAGSIVINGGARYTNSRHVELAVSAKDDLTDVQMQIGSSKADYQPLEALSTPKTLEITSPGDGVKMVFARFQDSMYNNSPDYSDSIILDTKAPSVPGTPKGSGSSTVEQAVTFKWTASTDTASGIAGYYCRIGKNPGSSDVFEGFVKNTRQHTFAGISGVRYFCRVRAMDVAGNMSGWSQPSAGTKVYGRTKTTDLKHW